jgi:hypothetical protein
VADERARELERRFHETGSAEDEQAWLQARLRGGELDPIRLRLAAYLGHGPSQALLGDDAPEVPETFRGWTSGLGDFGDEVVMRATIAAARRALPVVAPLFLPRDADHPVPVLEAAEACVAYPSPERAQALFDAARRAQVAANGRAGLHLDGEHAAAWRACLATAQVFAPDARPWLGPEHARLAIFSEVRDEVFEGDVDVDAADPESLPKLAGERIRAAIREVLIPWALGAGHRRG